MIDYLSINKKKGTDKVPRLKKNLWRLCYITVLPYLFFQKRGVPMTTRRAFISHTQSNTKFCLRPWKSSCFAANYSVTYLVEMENFQVGKLCLISNNSSHNSKNSPHNTNNYTTHNDSPCIVGQYGKIYKGLFFTTPVRIQSLLKQDFKIDMGVLQKPNHSNIIRFLCSEETDAFQ